MVSSKKVTNLFVFEKNICKYFLMMAKTIMQNKKRFVLFLNEKKSDN